MSSTLQFGSFSPRAERLSSMSFWLMHCSLVSGFSPGDCEVTRYMPGWSASARAYAGRARTAARTTTRRIFLFPFIRGSRVGEKVDEFVDGRGVQPARVHAVLENLLAAFLGKTQSEVALEFFHEQRHAFLAAALVADRVFDNHFGELRSIRQLDGQRIGDRALRGIVVVLGELGVFDATDL